MHVETAKFFCIPELQGGGHLLQCPIWWRQWNEWTNERTVKRADARNRIWCILALIVTSGGNNFKDLPDNQLTKFIVFIAWSRIFIPAAWNCYEASRFIPHRMNAPDRQNGQTDKETCFFARLLVRLSLRWSLTLYRVSPQKSQPP